MGVIDRAAVRLLRACGDKKTKHVIAMAGAEQEYFLLDKKTAQKRLDIVTCGRTLFGARPPKGQELDDHYFGVIKPRVAAYMADLNEELWNSVELFDNEEIKTQNFFETYHKYFN